MSDDVIRFSVLPDGTVRFETDEVSGANHKSAEDFLTYITMATGGAVTRTARTGHTEHEHTHGHTHGEQARA